jgi:hypothetical protein
MTFPYVWSWSQPPTPIYGERTSGWFDRERKGMRCRIVARGPLNSATIEFEDGYRVCTSRSGLRRA